MPDDQVGRWEWEGGAVGTTQEIERARPIPPHATDERANTSGRNEQPRRQASAVQAASGDPNQRRPDDRGTRSDSAHRRSGAG